MVNIKSDIKKVQDWFDSVSDEEFIEHLKECGFKVTPAEKNRVYESKVIDGVIYERDLLDNFEFGEWKESKGEI